MLQVTHFFLKFMFKYRVRSWVLMSWIQSWIRWWCRWRHRWWRRHMMMGWISWGTWWNRVDWMVMDRWKSWGRDGSNTFQQNVGNRTSSTDRNVASQVQRQTVVEGAEMPTINGDAVHRMLRGDSNFKRLVSLNR